MITGLSMPIGTMAISQYLGVPATGAAMLDGKIVVTTADGIHVLDSTASDNGTQIAACVKTVKTDFGQHGRKRVRSMFIRGLTHRLRVSLSTETQTLTLHHQHIDGFSQDGGFVSGQRSQSGRYWQFEFRNMSGEDFSVDGVDVVINTLSLRR